LLLLTSFVSTEEVNRTARSMARDELIKNGLPRRSVWQIDDDQICVRYRIVVEAIKNY